ncbi:uncharacterized protein LOC100555440 isoform X4 [Anolis carolinensis]|uniref:uncharacterized protein LOC100555440 isoform X4 n=1 Tax=Anolis carolinensis TaxID=28377 RepID=UPI002F2B361A
MQSKCTNLSNNDKIPNVKRLKKFQTLDGAILSPACRWRCCLRRRRRKARRAGSSHFEGNYSLGMALPLRMRAGQLREPFCGSPPESGSRVYAGGRNSFSSRFPNAINLLHSMWKGRRIEELPSPALVVDLDVAKRNAQRMRERCRELGVTLRPHMKTHKTLEGAQLMTGGTRRRIVVSTLAEARLFADEGGFEDILFAYPLPFDKVEECAALAERMEAFHVLVDSAEALAQLEQRPLETEEGKRWKVWLKIDCDNHRAGLKHDDPSAVELAKAIAEGATTELAGVYAHCGNSYGCNGVPDIQSVARTTTQLTLQFMEKCAADDDWVLPTRGYCRPGLDQGHRPLPRPQPAAGGLRVDRPESPQPGPAAHRVRHRGRTPGAQVGGHDPGAREGRKHGREAGFRPISPGKPPPPHSLSS